MRELIERFSYRFQLWQKERYGDQWAADPAVPRNPLRVFAVIALVSIAADLYYILFQHRVDALIVLGLISGAAFLVLYIRCSAWAWHLTVAQGPVFLLLFWLLFFLGGLSHPPRVHNVGFMSVVFLFQVALLVGVIVWLFWIRESYLRYVQDASSPKT
jgi:hypothetical protein